MWKPRADCEESERNFTSNELDDEVIDLKCELEQYFPKTLLEVRIPSLI